METRLPGEMAEWLQMGARAMGIALPEGAAERLCRYHALLTDANARMNLTRVLEPRESVDAHYLDSLSALCPPGLIPSGARLLDVGSGAGMPALALAVARPDLRVTLLDALAKRVRFLREVAQALSLDVEVLHARAEDAGRDPLLREKFDVVTARAVAPLCVLAELCLPFARVGGRMLAYKGPAAREELEQARGAVAKLGGGPGELREARIPGRDWRHALVSIDKMHATPPAYPRKAGEPARKPLS